MKWFKFYGQDYLSDPKMLSLTASGRSCWITLLCYSSVNDNGKITFMSEEQLMAQAGLDFIDDEWDLTKGILKKLENLKMIRIDNREITVINWEKRQETSLTGYERVKRYRNKLKNDNADDNAKITPDKNRIDKNRIDNTMAFDVFWSLYPKKVDKKKSEIKWNKLSLETQKIIVDDLPKRIKDRKWKAGFIPNATTYLNGERWNDEIEVDIIKSSGSVELKQ